ncbi:ammonium transporter Rh type A-like [Paramacrobiotus metropolitanus]|uniref:ammonium transporter Rh type A-like n=1 Tax=Paramacrobiotus metropolitanus TaxID=2943436 RepID=UPI002445B448|nr:ammonium transporter Rh type A-like [Paramacrobiotus metropolitanus]XP_055354453.1 ammonium transporter Rh type A-like [Paramacrobiotus metropolitanus]
MAHDSAGNRKFAIVLSVFQVIFIILFGIFGRYHDDALPRSGLSHQTTTLSPQEHRGRRSADGDSEAYTWPKYAIQDYYPMFQDVHVMMFIGFGYLMTFLRKYGYSSLGINFLLAAFVIQWATLMRGFLHMEGMSFKIDLTTLLTSDFTVAAILITFGAVLGKLSPLQYLIMALIEVAVSLGNEYICVHYLKTRDIGGSIFVHIFGAYFGLAVSRMLYRWEYSVTDFNTLKFTTKTTDLFSMIGTIFLWMYWPSFNSAVAEKEFQQRAVINTYFAMASCCVVTFICSHLFHHNKFSMELVQNATLAGGVALGATADMIVQPYGALIIGAGAGILSCVGFHYINPILENKLKVHDTCGVNNLHGMPGILAALISGVVFATATPALYGDSFYDIYGKQMDTNAIQKTPLLDSSGKFVPERTPMQQAGLQMAALGATLGMAIVSGIITGLIIRMKIWDPLPGPALFDDAANFALPDPVPWEQESDIRHRLRTIGRDDEIAAAIPLTKGFPNPRDERV